MKTYIEVDGGTRGIDIAPTNEISMRNTTENMSSIAFSDRFICKQCKIYIEDWARVVIDQDDGEKLHYEYEFKFCPECGAKIKDGETNGIN